MNPFLKKLFPPKNPQKELPGRSPEHSEDIPSPIFRPPKLSLKDNLSPPKRFSLQFRNGPITADDISEAALPNNISNSGFEEPQQPAPPYQKAKVKKKRILKDDDLGNSQLSKSASNTKFLHSPLEGSNQKDHLNNENSSPRISEMPSVSDQSPALKLPDNMLNEEPTQNKSLELPPLLSKKKLNHLPPLVNIGDPKGARPSVDSHNSGQTGDTNSAQHQQPVINRLPIGAHLFDDGVGRKESPHSLFKKEAHSGGLPKEPLVNPNSSLYDPLERKISIGKRQGLSELAISRLKKKCMQ
jgi:hypothetical protein